METLKNEIIELLTKKLKDKFVFGVSIQDGYFGGKYMQIWVACSLQDINQVRGQKPQIISLSLDLKTMELQPQGFGGNGGRSIYREPNLNDPQEKFLAMKSVKIPFRTPQPTAEKIKVCIAKFVDNYIQTLRDNKDILKYKNLVDYNYVLSE